MEGVGMDEIHEEQPVTFQSLSNNELPLIHNELPWKKRKLMIVEKNDEGKEENNNNNIQQQSPVQGGTMFTQENEVAEAVQETISNDEEEKKTSIIVEEERNNKREEEEIDLNNKSNNENANNSTDMIVNDESSTKAVNIKGTRTNKRTSSSSKIEVGSVPVSEENQRPKRQVKVSHKISDNLLVKKEMPARNKEKKDKIIGCQECKGCDDPMDLLLCDSCNEEYHLYCLSPPLIDVPKGKWYCIKCKNIAETEKSANKRKNDIELCKVCKRKTNGESLRIICDKCEGEYHMCCLTPPLTHVPKGDWFCPNCIPPPPPVEKKSRKRKVSSIDAKPERPPSLFTFDNFSDTIEEMEKMSALRNDTILSFDAPNQFALVGRRILCFIKDFNIEECHPGRIMKFNPHDGKHFIQFDTEKKPQYFRISNRSQSKSAPSFKVAKEIIWTNEKNQKKKPSLPALVYENVPRQPGDENSLYIIYFYENTVDVLKPNDTLPFDATQCIKRRRTYNRETVLAVQEALSELIVMNQTSDREKEATIQLWQNYLVGKDWIERCITVFRPEINYPAGKLCNGRILQFKPQGNKHFIIFEDRDFIKPCWLVLKECHFSLIIDTELINRITLKTKTDFSGVTMPPKFNTIELKVNEINDIIVPVVEHKELDNKNDNNDLNENNILNNEAMVSGAENEELSNNIENNNNMDIIMNTNDAKNNDIDNNNINNEGGDNDIEMGDNVNLSNDEGKEIIEGKKGSEENKDVFEENNDGAEVTNIGADEKRNEVEGTKDDIEKVEMNQPMEIDDPILKPEFNIVRQVPHILSEEEVKNRNILMTGCNNCMMSFDNTESEPNINCSSCECGFHLSCMDPPMMEKPDSNSKWLCFNCQECKGCGETKTIQDGKWTLHSFEGEKQKISLCKTCAPAFKNNQYCPLCRKIWKNDDINMICCDSCSMWCHGSCCDIDPIALDLIARGLNPQWGASFHCNKCMKHRLLSLLNSICALDIWGMFLEPVTVEMAPTYFDIIEEPIDLLTIRKKVEAFEYKGFRQFRVHIDQLCRNALVFNPPLTKIWNEAVKFHKNVNDFLDKALRDPRSKIEIQPSAYGEEIKEILRQNSLSEIKKKETERNKLALTKVIKPVIHITNLYPPKENNYYKSAPILDIQSMVEAQVELCLVCGSSGDPFDFLFCRDCGEAIHYFCQELHSPPTESMRRNWRCSNCKICDICAITLPTDDTDLIFCEICDRTFHLSCMQPVIEKIPDTNFVCGKCIDCRHCHTEQANVSYSETPYACRPCLEIQKKIELTDLKTCTFCRSTCEGEVDGSGYTCQVCYRNYHTDCENRAAYFKAGLLGLYDEQFSCSSCTSSREARSMDCKGIFDLINELQKYRQIVITKDVATKKINAAVLRNKEDSQEEEEEDNYSDIVSTARSNVSGSNVVAYSGYLNNFETPTSSRMEARNLLPRTPHQISPQILHQGLHQMPPQIVQAQRATKNVLQPTKPCALLSTWSKPVERIKDSRVCEFCRGGDELTSFCGRLLYLGLGFWAHANCSLWSNEVFEAVGGELQNVVKARSRGKSFKCCLCQQKGASVGCCYPNCLQIFHYKCAHESGCAMLASKEIFCALHTSSEIQRHVGSKKATLLLPTHVIRRKMTISEAKQPTSPIFESAFRIGGLSLLGLGESVTAARPYMHDENYIYPVGYKSARIYWSYKKPYERIVYICEVFDGVLHADSSHLCAFRVTALDDQEGFLESTSIEEIFMEIRNRINIALQKHQAPNISTENVKANTNRAFLGNLTPLKERLTWDSYGAKGIFFLGIGLHPILNMIESHPSSAIAAIGGKSNKFPTYKYHWNLPQPGSIKNACEAIENYELTSQCFHETGSARTEGYRELNRAEKALGFLHASRKGSFVRTASEARAPDSIFLQDDMNVVAVEERKETQKANDFVNFANQYQFDVERYDFSLSNQYKAMKRLPLDHRLIVRRSPIHGWGLFTLIDLKKDDTVIEYVGEGIRQKVADLREKQYENDGMGSCYLFRLDENAIIDATKRGSIARFINHSCNPTCYSRVIDVDGEKHITIFASRDIEKFSEVTYDYKFPHEEEALMCHCGAENCIGRFLLFLFS